MMKDASFMLKMECKTNFSRRLKQFDGLTWLTLILRQIYATDQCYQTFVVFVSIAKLDHNEDVIRLGSYYLRVFSMTHTLCVSKYATSDRPCCCLNDSMQNQLILIILDLWRNLTVEKHKCTPFTYTTLGSAKQ